MSMRRFGPTLGAGTVVIEKQAERIAEAAPLGVTLYVTPLERGPTDKVISTYGKKELARKIGSRISGYDGPDCAYDFWDHSEGAGELHLLRVTTGLERAAKLDLVSREMTSDVDGWTSADHKNRPLIRVAAKNGGRWASQKRTIYREVALITDVGVTTLTTGLTMLADEWVGATLKLDAVSSKTYKVIANNTSGVITVSSDSDMDADVGVATDKGYQLILDTAVGVEGLDRTLSIVTGDGETDPVNEFSLAVYNNETQVRRWPNLSMDPTSKHYFVRQINDDLGNLEIEVSDLLSPSDPNVSDRRPCNGQGIVASITADTLTTTLFQARRTAGVSNPTVALSGSTDVMKYVDTFEFEVTSVTAGAGTDVIITMKSMRVGGGTAVHAAVTAAAGAGVPFVFNAPTSPLVPNITITSGSTAFSLGDKFQVDYQPFEPDALVGGYVCPDIVNKPNARYKIASNTHKVITIQTGDLTDANGDGDAADRFAVFYPQTLGGSDALSGTTPMNGSDGLSGLADSDYTTVHLNPAATPARSLLTQNKGLVKVATPDRYATAVSQAGIALAEAFNWQYRVEIDPSVDTESAAIDFINTTIGRSDYGVTLFPSYVSVVDPERPGQNKTTPNTGMVHGREALMAKTWDGYHKAAAGVDVTLPRIVDTPFELVLNEEVLNPQGINVLRKYKTDYIVWGDRTIASDPSWKFKHQREQMSHYENRLREAFDWIIFAINDVNTQGDALVAMTNFFLPEFTKRALGGATFAASCIIKIDNENNTAETRADGDLNCEISLKLADTVERFVITIGKQGIFDGVSA